MKKHTSRGMSLVSNARGAAMSVTLAVVAMVAWVTPAEAVDRGAPRIAPPVSQASGNTLTQWLTTYFAWYWGTDQDLAQSRIGRVQLMPLPDAGELEITLPPGTPFVLPLVALTGERYECYPDPTCPDDDPAFLLPLTQMSAHLTIDGRTVVSDANQAAFTTPLTYFDPIVPYPEPTDYGSIAAVWFTSIGIVSPPLPAGVHVLHLEATLNVEGIFSVSYDNTWTVTVTRH